MARHKNQAWDLPEGTPNTNGKGGRTHSWDSIQTALLMDIRDELQQLNRVLSCGNLSRYERVLKDIRRKLPTRRRKKRQVKP